MSSAALSRSKSDSAFAGVIENTHIMLRGGRTAQYLGVCFITGKHRVRTYNHRGQPILPPKSGNDFVYTTWLLNDAGVCRGDGAQSEYDFIRSEQPA